MWKNSEIIFKGKLILHQLEEMGTAEIIVHLTNEELTNYGYKVNLGKEPAVIFWEILTTNILKAKELNS